MKHSALSQNRIKPMETAKRIFPAEVVENSVEKHFEEYNPRSRRLYLAVLGSLGLAFILMFIIKVDVTVRSAGIVRPVQERTDIRPPVEGIVDSIYVAVDQHVDIGQPLMKIRSQVVEEQSLAISTQKGDVEAQIHDLDLLLQGQTSGLTSTLYIQQYALYKEKLLNAQSRYDVASREYGRYAKLARNKVISPAEFDKYTYQMRDAGTELSMAREQQRAVWEADLARLRQQQRDVNARSTMNEEQKNLYTIRSTVKGTIQQLKGVQVGSFVQQNEVLGEISPDSGLIVEAQVLPKDIGFLKPGTKVRLQVDAFDYNVWGMLTGTVTSISNDVFIGEKQSQPYFKVRCLLDRNYLTLRNGAQGMVTKGMMVQARFFVTRRSLFQLLYDQTDDWINPNQTPKKDAPATASR